MPVIFREGGFRYFFFSNEGSPREPPHVHVKKADSDAKVWLEPEVSVAESFGFNSGEIARILRIVRQNRSSFLRFWHEHFTEGRSL